MDRERWQRKASAPETPAEAAAKRQAPGGESSPKRAAKAARIALVSDVDNAVVQSMIHL